MCTLFLLNNSIDKTQRDALYLLPLTLLGLPKQTTASNILAGNFKKTVVPNNKDDYAINTPPQKCCRIPQWDIPQYVKKHRCILKAYL
jgi:hypothetical protein